MDVDFRISSYCHHGGCVAVGSDADEILVRSSRVADGPVLRFTAEEWDAFVSGVRDGEFDRSVLQG
ncbi:DUF397 domain-containing protein [Pseudonocardia sp. HH130630-07]|uniref:DUF397 domain-containing protein n=1 Tax=Pseudonocardia sp. HH130630-07 TaxID=1690815 RepID=UPI000815261C|nr:DUF397 domain-containing protein [Pseudonocardia sp. HH130630-07]ANY06528.1 hypothetical protein AFB00_09755 [Pseudonocardia sp. HH130630-07]